MKRCLVSESCQKKPTMEFGLNSLTDTRLDSSLAEIIIFSLFIDQSMMTLQSLLAKLEILLLNLLAGKAKTSGPNRRRTFICEL
jgi:hypothetical protein